MGLSLILGKKIHSTVSNDNMFSIYTSAFNITSLKFDYQLSLKNFSNFVGEEGEVIIAVPEIPGDDTFEILCDWIFESELSNVFVFPCDVDRNDPAFDGKVKDFALQQCCNKVLIQMDLDEIIPLGQKPLWENYAWHLLNSNGLDCFMVPSIDLWGDEHSIRWDAEKKAGFKWRMHKDGLKRGVVDFAKRGDGTHDITKSDSCELLTEQNELVNSFYIVNNTTNLEEFLSSIINNIYTLHLGYIDFDSRVLRNKRFWKEQWKIENGSDVYVPETVKELEKTTFRHNLFERLSDVV